MWGNYDTTEASSIMVVFERCSPLKNKVKCKTDAQIDEWMQSKYIIMISNQKNFI